MPRQYDAESSRGFDSGSILEQLTVSFYQIVTKISSVCKVSCARGAASAPTNFCTCAYAPPVGV